MSQNPQPPVVMVDGVLYVPVSQSNPAVPALEDVIVSQWAGDNWREDYPDAPGYLRVIVDDDSEGRGETVTEFLGRLVRGLSRRQIT